MDEFVFYSIFLLVFQLHAIELRAFLCRIETCPILIGRNTKSLELQFHEMKLINLRSSSPHSLSKSRNLSNSTSYVATDAKAHNSLQNAHQPNRMHYFFFSYEMSIINSIFFSLHCVVFVSLSIVVRRHKKDSENDIYRFCVTFTHTHTARSMKYISMIHCKILSVDISCTNYLIKLKPKAISDLVCGAADCEPFGEQMFILYSTYDRFINLIYQIHKTFLFIIQH